MKIEKIGTYKSNNRKEINSMNILIFLAYLWQRRFTIVLPTLLFPLMMWAWSQGHVPYYEASTTLHFNASKLESPLIGKLINEDEFYILERVLKSDSLVEDTLFELGELIDGVKKETREKLIEEFKDRIALEIVSSDLIRLKYRNLSRDNIESSLETLAFNFVDEILAPERLRVQQQLSVLEEQVKSYNARQKEIEQQLRIAKTIIDGTEGSKADQRKSLKRVVALEFEADRMNSKKVLAQDEYDLLLARNKNFFTSAYNKENPTAIMWFVEKPLLVSADPAYVQNVSAIQTGFLYGLLFGLFTIIFRAITDRTLRSDNAIAMALPEVKILGRLPDLGAVSFKDGGIMIDISR